MTRTRRRASSLVAIRTRTMPLQAPAATAQNGALRPPRHIPRALNKTPRTHVTFFRRNWAENLKSHEDARRAPVESRRHAWSPSTPNSDVIPPRGRPNAPERARTPERQTKQNKNGLNHSQRVTVLPGSQKNKKEIQGLDHQGPSPRAALVGNAGTRVSRASKPRGKLAGGDAPASDDAARPPPAKRKKNRSYPGRSHDVSPLASCP